MVARLVDRLGVTQPGPGGSIVGRSGAGPRRYRVRRKEIVRKIADALQRSRARIVSEADPCTAPFEFTTLTPDGEQLGLIVYAFTANEYKQRGRPSDEHRFQVKYGSDVEGYHELYFDEDGHRITLFLGVGVDEDDGLFVACDPAMHNPTRFFRSVEFKDEHIKQARSKGWFGWERDRSDIRRKNAKPLESYEVEALLAFTPENFLRYVQLERATTGLAPGERLLIAERLAPQRMPGGPPGPHELEDELERELGYTRDEIMELIRGGGFRLRAALRGAAAERHLEGQLREVPGVDRVNPIDEDARPDFEVEYRGRRVLIECKNVLRTPNSGGLARVDFQKTRASTQDPCSRYYRPEQFDVLAACLHPITARWEYRFRWTREMNPHPRCVGHLHHRVVVENAGWHRALAQLLERITE